MSDNNGEDKKEYSAEEFIKEYKALCINTGWEITASPSYLRRDDGSYSTVIQFSAGRLPKAQT